MAFDIQILPTKPKNEILVSPSQIGRWDNCQRWWAWEYIAKIRGPQHPSAIFGSLVHAKLELWLRESVPPVVRPFDNSDDAKASTLALRMISTLTNNGIQPGQGAVERYFCFRTEGGHHYNGLIDWSGIVFGVPCVTDHKTSSSIEKYGKTEADLHNDVQSVIYAIVGFTGFNTDTLGLLWNYGETKGRGDTKAVKTLVHLPVMREKFERVIEPAVDEIVWHRRANTDPLTFPPNAAACGMFGGCPHQQRCKLTNQQKVGGLMNNGQPTMAERMAGFPQGAQGGPGLPQPQMPQGQPQQYPPQQYQQPMQQAPQGFPQGQPQQPPQQYQQPMPPGFPQGQPQQPPQQYLQTPQQAPQQMALPGAPMQMLPPPGAPHAPFGGQQAPQQAPQQAYAPNIAPNPPESGKQVPASEEEEDDDASKGKGGPGRPKGSRNKALTIEQQVFLLGVQGVLANANFNPMDQVAADVASAAGELVLRVFKQKFGG